MRSSNGKRDYFQKLIENDRDERFDKVIKYLQAQVPEIAAFGRMLDNYSKSSKEKVTLIIRMDGEPDPESSDIYQRDYYAVYVGENHPDHTARWYTFLAHRNLNKILADDPLTGGYISLAEWRKANNGV